MPGPAPMAAAPSGSKASQTPSAGMAFRSVGAPVSSTDWVTTVKVRPPRTGKRNQSFCPTSLKCPHHRPLAGSRRGEASVPMASW
jgi:hypothetical protein